MADESELAKTLASIYLILQIRLMCSFSLRSHGLPWFQNRWRLPRNLFLGSFPYLRGNYNTTVTSWCNPWASKSSHSAESFAKWRNHNKKSQIFLFSTLQGMELSSSYFFFMLKYFISVKIPLPLWRKKISIISNSCYASVPVSKTQMHKLKILNREYTSWEYIIWSTLTIISENVYFLSVCIAHKSVTYWVIKLWNYIK